MSNVLQWSKRAAARHASSVAILGLLAACASPPPTPAPPDAAATPIQMINPTIVRARARWVPAEWADLPGWDADHSRELWPSLLRGCERPAAGWAGLCAQARSADAQTFDDAATRAWLQRHLKPYRVEAFDGMADGLITGYVEATLRASRVGRSDFRAPLYAPPADLATRKPYWTRQQLETVPAAKAALRGRALAYVNDPLDALYLQVQGSGRVRVAETDGSGRWVRFAFAASNDQPYKSVASWLISQGEMTTAQASWPAIKNWARQNPKRVNDMLWSNPRFVFFREEPMPDPLLGPKGAQGVALTPGRSIAVDPQSIPFGTPVWLATTEPLTSAPLRRVVMAQDTGSAITGAVRADYFWGWGEDAEAQAGRMKQPLRMWALWPKP
jgi:membrane-bound lytic murein transglycosylase A